MSRPDHDQAKTTKLLLPVVVFGKPLVDSGAERSVFLMKLVPPLLIFPTCLRQLKLHGHFQATLGVKALRKEFKVNFVATKTRPNFGANFFTQCGLKLDMRNKMLTDPLANISVELVSRIELESKKRLAEDVKSDSFIAKHCPTLLIASDYSIVPMDVTKHCIETTGSPMFFVGKTTVIRQALSCECRI